MSSDAALSAAARKARLVRAFLRGEPVHCTWQLSPRCESFCHFCEHRAESAAEALDAAECERIAAELGRRSSLLVSLTGADPFLRDDLPEVVRSVAARHFPLLVTNGWLVGRERARATWAAGLEAASVYKYLQAICFEPFLAEVFLREALPALRGQQWDLIVPVPLHPTKRREREFNQAERMAGHLSRATRIPMNRNLLRPVVPTRTQTLLTRQQRASNVRKALAMRLGQHLDRERVILVDDVFTTGATTDACARVLRKGGAGEVCVWTVARGL